MKSVRHAFALAAATLLCAIPVAGGTADEPPYQLNAILPVTGSESFLGKEEANALTVMQGMLNKQGGIGGGREVRFVVQDDQSSPVLAVQLANGLIAKHVPVIFGSSAVGLCGAIDPLVKDGPINYCFSPGIHPQPGSYVFSSGLSTTDLLAASAKYFHGRGWTKIGVITSTDATGQDADRNITAAFGPASGETIVAHDHFNPTDVSVTAQMAHIKGAGAQALIAWSSGTPFGTLLRGAVEAGLNIPILTTSGNLTYPQMKAYAQFLPKDLYFPASPAFAPNQLPNGPVKQAVAQYEAAFKAAGINPDEGYTLAWDPARLIIDGLKKLGPNATAAQLKDFIDAQTDWVGILGRHNFRAIPQRGVGIDSVVMVRWDAGRGTWVGISKPGGAPL